MMTTEPMRQLLECKRCLYGAKGEWRRRTKGRLPKQCPNCKSYKWDEDEVRGRGRPMKVAECIPGKWVAHRQGCPCTSCRSVRGELADDLVTVTADTVAEAKAEESAPVITHDVPMIEHGAACSCTSCLWERGAL